MPEKKTISAREVVADIRVGMTDEQLMGKHQLSVKGLQSLKNKLLAAGLITQVELDSKTSHGKVATPSVDKKAFARNIAAAVKAGLSDDEIVKKFGISAGKLPTVFTSLMKTGHLTQEDFEQRPGGFEETVDLTSENHAVLKCPNCRMPQNKPFEVCPQCGVIVEKYKAKLAREKQFKRSRQGSVPSPPGIPTPVPLPVLPVTSPSEIQLIHAQDRPGNIMGFLKKIANSLQCTQCGKMMGIGEEATASLPAAYKKEGLRICWECMSKINIPCAKCGYIYNVKKGETECPQCLRDTKGCVFCGKILGKDEDVSAAIGTYKLIPDPGGNVNRVCWDCLSIFQLKCEKCGLSFKTSKEKQSCPNCDCIRDATSRISIDGSTELMLAAEAGLTELVERNLENQSNIAVKDNLGRTAFMRAAAAGQYRHGQTTVGSRFRSTRPIE